jgi:hypothetical protein
MSELDQTKLEEKKNRKTGGITARCPACFEHGHDKTGNHLVIWPSGKFGCIQFPGDQGIEHRKRIFALVGVRDEKPARSKGFDWQRCVDALKPNDLVRLGNERWFSRAFCSWLHVDKKVGFHNGSFGFPVGHNGTVAGTHYRVEYGSWRYYPQGIKTEPLVIGDLANARQVYPFESQWDMFAFAETGLTFIEKETWPSSLRAERAMRRSLKA